MFADGRRRPLDPAGGACELDRRVGHLEPEALGVLHLHQHVPGLYLRISRRLSDIVQRAAGDAQWLQLLQPFAGGLLAKGLVEDGLQLGVVLRPQARRLEARVVDELWQAQRGQQQLPLVVHAPAQGNDDPAVLGRERLEGRRGRVPRPQRPGHLAGGEVAHKGVLQDRDLAVQHTYVEHLPPAALLPLVQGGQYADGRVQTGSDIPQGDARPNRPPARLAGDAHDASHALHNDVQGGLVAIGARLPEAGGGGVDEARVALRQHVVAQTQALHSAGREVLHHHIGLLDQPQKEVSAGGALQVDADAALAPVHREEVGGLVVQVGARGAGHVAVGRALDLDDVGAQVAQHHAGERPSQDPGEVQDADTGQRSSHKRRAPPLHRL
ncbi:hypothetical protein HRbin24_00990 [bacterium HR24]|nr:hypothetical protein HRbin24_00990 [bacterium HR24]